MEEQIKTEKKRLRLMLRDLAQSLSDAYIERSDRGIREALLALDVWKQASTVFIYVSVGREPETRGIILAALAAGKTVAVPRCLRGGEMEARVIQSLDGLMPGPFGIPEPGAGHRLLPPQDIELAVAPCVAADRQGFRLGHGGGYYDRYLAKVHCPAVCLCRARLLQNALPHDALDRPMDRVITEHDCVVFEK
ncbi:MAG: 5-formyltetrahydrofolate cyclo-ligase [Bacillota bacterium]